MLGGWLGKRIPLERTKGLERQACPVHMENGANFKKQSPETKA